LKLETPFYQPNRSLGFELSTFYDALSLDPWKGGKHMISKARTAPNAAVESVEYQRDDPNTRFQYIWGFSMLGAFKFKFPFQTDIGHFAMTLTPKAGLVGILSAKDTKNLYFLNL